jgi:two-component system, OmpR family, sensor kinase
VIAGRLLGPMRRLAHTARRISRSDLGPRLEPRGDAEVAEMASSFNAMVDRLEDTLTEMRDLAHETAHELRAPLTVCRCQLMAIRDGLQAPEEPARIAIGEIDRMSRLVGDLETLGELRHSRLQASAFELEPRLRGVFERTLGLAPRAWRLESVARVRVRADPDMLARNVDGGGNRASGNAEPAQCFNVSCTP